jgi:hypothetical protein
MKKIVNILIVTLLIATTALPVVGTMNIDKKIDVKKNNVFNDSSTGLQQQNHCLFSGFGNNKIFIVETPDIQLPGHHNTLIFWKQFEIDEGDRGYIEIWDGSSWTVINILHGYIPHWEKNEYDLSNFAGQSIRIRFRYETLSSSSSSGWHVDNIYVISDGIVVFREDFEGYSATDYIPPWWTCQPPCFPPEGWRIEEKYSVITEEFILVVNQTDDSLYCIPHISGTFFGTPELIDDNLRELV